MADTEVLVVGAGPVGLTAAIELARRGVRSRIVDARAEPARYAKAVGIQPRSLELFRNMGVLREILDAAVRIRGQLVYVNGAEAGWIELALPADIPYGFVGLPQYETERILSERLAATGITIERGRTLTSFTTDDTGVTAELHDTDGPATVRTRYLIGCDGAHSAVRKGLGLTFDGAAFTEQYMLGDVELDWSIPPGYGVRSMHVTDGRTDDLLVCIPLPGRGRYRVSMLVPDELSTPPTGSGVEHGFEGGRAPELRHLQAVLDRLAPEPVHASTLRWSSVFRISHRIVDSYSRGRVFVAGDAAHIHPPTGAQGMNTGIQDAADLAWKLALTLDGAATDTLLDSYDIERRAVGAEVVGRTVRNARDGIGAGESDTATVLLREAQLLIDYGGSPLLANSVVPEPHIGMRAPDAAGLRRGAVSFPIRLFDLLTGPDHTAVLYAGADTDPTGLEALATAVRERAHRHLDVYLLTPPDGPDSAVLPVVRDSDGDFARAYHVHDGTAAFVVRPDGCLGYAGPADLTALTTYLGATFR